MAVVPETAVAVQQYSDSNKMVTTGGKQSAAIATINRLVLWCKGTESIQSTGCLLQPNGGGSGGSCCRAVRQRYQQSGDYRR